MVRDDEVDAVIRKFQSPSSINDDVFVYSWVCLHRGVHIGADYPLHTVPEEPKLAAVVAAILKPLTTPGTEIQNYVVGLDDSVDAAIELNAAIEAAEATR